MDPVVSIAAAVIIGGLFIYAALWIFKSEVSPKAETSSSEHADTEKKTDNGSESDSKPKKNTKVKVDKSKRKEVELKHPWYVNTFKGPAGDITSFDCSPNGKYLVCCATDRSLFLWSMKDMASKEHKSTRASVEYDTAVKIKFSPDSRSFISSLEIGNNIRIFKFSKKEDGGPTNIQPALETDFPKTHSQDIMSIGIDSIGNFVMTADLETKVDIFSIKGEKYQSIDTGTMKNYGACVSPCGRYVAVWGFTPDAKVWEVMFDKGRNFTGVKRAFDLKGHTASILSLAISADSSKMVTVSKDGSWKLWRTDVEYTRGQDAFLLSSGQYLGSKESAIAAISPDGRVIVVASENNLLLYNAVTTKLDANISNIFRGTIKHTAFSVDGKYLLCCGDRQIKVFHNVTGLRAVISDTKEKLVSCNKNMESRLNTLLTDTRNALEKLGFSE